MEETNNLSSLTKLYAVNTIKCAILAMWLQFFKNDDILKLFAPLKDTNNEDLTSISEWLVLHQYVEINTVKKDVAEWAEKCRVESNKENIACTTCYNYTESEKSDIANYNTHLLTCANHITHFKRCAALCAELCVTKDYISTESKDDSLIDSMIPYIKSIKYASVDFAHLSYSAALYATRTNSAKLALLNLIFAYTYILK